MDWPFLARANEIEALSQIGSAPTATGALVVGPPGVGKTSLLRRVAADLAASGRPTRWVVGSARDRGIDFASIAGMLGDAPGTSTLRTTDVHRSAFAELAVGPVGQRVCVFVDDANLIDASSASLLHKLADTGTITLVMAARSLADTGPAIHALWASGRIEQLHLTRLEDRHMSGLIRAVLGANVHPVSRAIIVESAEGIPLVAREIIAASLDSGRLDQMGGWWRLRPGWESLDRVGEVAAYAFGSIEPDLRQQLEILAVAGTLEFEALSRVRSGFAVEELEASGLARVVTDRSRSNVQLEHSLVGRCLMGAMGTAKRRRLASAAADTLSDLGQRRVTDPFRIAMLRLAAGERTAPKTAVGAAKWALDALRTEDAERLARAGVGADPAVDEGYLTLAHARVLRGASQGADEALHEAQQRGRKRKQRARCSVLAMRNLSVGSDRWGDAVEIGRRAARDLEGSRSGSEVQAEVDRYLIRMGGGELRGARKVLGVASGSADATDRTWREKASALGAIEWHLQRGGFDQAMHLAQGAALDEPDAIVASPLARHEAARYEVFARAMLGDLRDARALAERHLESALAERTLPLIGAWSAWLGQVQMLQGQVVAAVERFNDALIVLEDGDPFAVTMSIRAQRAVALVNLGKIDEALADIEGTMNAGLELLTDREAHGRAQRWFDAATGHRERAAEHAAEAASSLAAFGHLGLAVIAGHDAVRFGRADLVAAVMESSGHIDGRLLPAMVSHAMAAQIDDPEQLVFAGESYERLGALLFAAEAFTQASRASADREDRVGERTAAARSLQIRADLGNIQTPALSRDAGVLTPREAEIARLAAGGETSKRIAERLAISSRTVDNHLASVYTKLAIRGREDLASVLGMTAS